MIPGTAGVSRLKGETPMPTVDENFIKRIQPHSEEAERSVLGAMLMDRDAIVEAEDILVKEDF